MEADMNTVLNFSWQGPLVQRPELRSAIVSPTTPASFAADFAELNALDLLVVRDRDWNVHGLFFPEYLREHLPSNGRLSNLVLPDGSLSEVISHIGIYLPDFHSEMVNIHPNVRLCPIGPHVTSYDPCNKHRVSTKPY
jgi:hypothetical protein